MNLINNIKDFLYDQKYFISFFNEQIHLFNFVEIKKFTDLKIEFSFEKFDILIEGEKLVITKMLKNEVLVKGNIKSLLFIYE